MSYKFIKSIEGNEFYELDKSEVTLVESELGIEFPVALKDFYNEVGYGFLKNSGSNVNRLMDPESVRDFKLRVNDFEFFPDIEIYDEYEEGKLIFFEASETALMSIGTEKTDSRIYYYDVPIADSLEEFLIKMVEDDKYYLELLD
ncbi:SMI1/KNR4 family protein [Listeria booriae]|uniref:SMI1/KNR4 family protein n=1 Tax=Listeria booriae TaxID=1552123 RepID=A0A7X0XDV7_9LIST|nr:SMI1/KNR4 family protein [Listeria booriae]MBC1291486.1 SMI1/KNR4 family protein [Listeria booriae]MBC1335848.1 SMI1/KNR4 family protein [Listeria booriae]MBC1492400.1 SMI1/KNR4 family protein [Listeria booriae]MBC1503319.1 SMI1/KNR4 family protein [Listeria booriae]MBC1513524.1 SMI1/KNR4 family protein [Listeria booriae]